MSVELIIITAVSAFNLVCSVILLTMYKNAMTELNELKKVKTEVEEISSTIELNDTAFEPIKEEEFKTGKRSRFKFSMIGLKPGDIIEYKQYKAVVKNDNTVIFDNEELTTSAAAMKVYEKEHNGKKAVAIQGPDFWKYKGKTLYTIRKEMENN